MSIDEIELKKVEILKSEAQRINEKLLESLGNYRKVLALMYGDAPLGVLCLDKKTESVLNSNGCLRIYDLFNCNFAEIEGLSEARLRDLTTRVDEFLSMC